MGARRRPLSRHEVTALTGLERVPGACCGWCESLRADSAGEFADGGGDAGGGDRVSGRRREPELDQRDASGGEHAACTLSELAPEVPGHRAGEHDAECPVL